MSKVLRGWWRIVRIGGAKASQIGMVKARTADAAIREAIKEYEIDDPQERKRIAAMPYE